MEAVEEPRWLTAEEQQTWLELIGVLTWLPDAIDAQLQRDAGVSHFEYQVMAMLSMAPQRTRRMSEVAALANGSLTRLSRTVDRLDKRGWVTRRPDPEDGRSTLPCSPPPAGTRSSPPPQATSPRFAASSSTRSPRPRFASCTTSPTGSGRWPTRAHAHRSWRRPTAPDPTAVRAPLDPRPEPACAERPAP